MDEREASGHSADDCGDSNTSPVALTADTRIVQESGRWIVMLNVPYWDPSGDDHPVTNNWKRISDYATQQGAEVAASWITRSVNRQTRPPMGF